ncbi:acyl-CoA thioesterase [Cognaticolwellia mytili]|uniref:acyl-CoA thioesterase n=1 Tax=Cognaticolwellia mytili TaxID=1888913 RepID=UPI000A177274|nr:thioesterase family protein [Cognaticolwellia mytili]
MFSEVITARFSDTDALGHINNTMVPVWFEGARDPVFKWFMPELNLNEWRLILAKIDVNFHAQIYYGKEITLRTYISRIGGSSFDVYQELWQNDIKCASGTAVMVHFCYENQSSLKIPSNVENEMKKHIFITE